MSKKLIVILVIVVALAVGLWWWFRPIAADEFTPYRDIQRDAKFDVKDKWDGDAVAVKYLEQGWKPGDSMRYYRLTQGSKLIPYQWFLHLERAESGNAAGPPMLFADPENMNGYRYLPLQKNKDYNPDGLPIGFVRDPMRDDDPLKTDWLGLTCSACHTSEIRHNKTAYRIDGGPAMADHDSFLIDLTAAMKSTLDDPEKFERFATGVLGDEPVPAAKEKLKTDLQTIYEFRQEYNRRNKTDLAYGFARLDAFGRILNEVLVRDLDVHSDTQRKSPDAPVSYPFLWGITNLDRVQWNGIANNTKVEVGPLGRNVGEVLGVYGDVNVVKFDGKLDHGFRSSVRIRNLLRLEDTLARLQAPKWEHVVGKLDADQVKAGKQVFDKLCLNCHNPHKKNGAFIQTAMTPIKGDLNTDKRMAERFATRNSDVGNMAGRLTKVKQFGIDISVFQGKSPAGAILVGVVGRTIYGSDPLEYKDHFNRPQLKKDLHDINLQVIGKFESLREKFEEDPYLLINVGSEDDLMKYRGRPLDGIWATAPYLHNGSVPNLVELLKPSRDRVKSFQVGSRELDPVNVGFRMDKGFAFDTSLEGNSNSGHEYGAEELKADDAKRNALLEYLKSL